METDWIKAKIQKGGRVCVPKPLREYYHLQDGEVVYIKIKKEEK